MGGDIKGGVYTANTHNVASGGRKETEEDTLKKLTAGLSFSLNLSDRQKAARDRVELPYVHQGQPVEDDNSGDSGNTGMLMQMSGLGASLQMNTGGGIDDEEEFEMEDMDEEDPEDEEI